MFLSEYFNTGVGYSAVNSIRSALSSLIQLHGIHFGKDPLVSRFLRGVFNIRPALPQYVTTWNISKVFKYVEKQQTLVNCDFKAVERLETKKNSNQPSHVSASLICQF